MTSPHSSWISFWERIQKESQEQAPDTLIVPVFLVM
jgi:hypothetical protein